MFISKAEKDAINESLKNMEARLTQLEIDAVIHFSKPSEPDYAPYGYTKDGVPKKQPGRKPTAIKARRP
jgi:hypothetical protein